MTLYASPQAESFCTMIYAATILLHKVVKAYIINHRLLLKTRMYAV